MAEIFGAVGTAISLLDLIIKRTTLLRRFWKDVTTARSDMHQILKKLNCQMAVLKELDDHGVLARSESAQTSWRIAVETLEEVEKLVEKFDIDNGMSGSRRILQAIKFASKKDDIKELREMLSDANEVLELAIASLNLRESRTTRTEIHELRIDVRDMHLKVGRLVAASPAKSTSETSAQIRSTWLQDSPFAANTGASLIGNAEEPAMPAQPQIRKKPITRIEAGRQISLPIPIVGSISIRRETRERKLISLDADSKGEDEAEDPDIYLKDESYLVIDIQPNWLFLSLGFNSYKLTPSLRYTRTLPNDHEIWDAVSYSDVSRIINILQSGSASINDVGVGGWSLLYYALMFADAETCSWLFENGCDPNTFTTYKQSLYFALRRSDVVDTNKLALLTDTWQLDPSVPDGNGLLPVSIMRDNSVLQRLTILSQTYMTESKADSSEKMFLENILNPSADIGVLRYCMEQTGCFDLDSKRKLMQRLDRTMDGLLTAVVNVWHGHNYSQQDGNYFEESILGPALDVLDLHNNGFYMGTPLRVILSIASKIGAVRSLYEWLCILYQRGVNLVDYFSGEAGLCPSNRDIVEGWYVHARQEFYYISVSNDVTLNNVTIEYSIAVADPPQPGALPGTWNEDLDARYCQEHSIHYAYRSGDRSSKGAEENETSPEEVLAQTTLTTELIHISDGERVVLQDGRGASHYRLWSLSTAGIDTGDLSAQSAIIYERNLIEHPILVDYGGGEVVSLTDELFHEEVQMLMSEILGAERLGPWFEFT